VKAAERMVITEIIKVKPIKKHAALIAADFGNEL